VFAAISRFLRHAKKTQFSNPLTGEEQLAHKSMQRLVEDHAALVHIKLVGRPQVVLVPMPNDGADSQQEGRLFDTSRHVIREALDETSSFGLPRQIRSKSGKMAMRDQSARSRRSSTCGRLEPFKSLRRPAHGASALASQTQGRGRIDHRLRTS
jgi:hypothetical protein